AIAAYADDQVSRAMAMQTRARASRRSVETMVGFCAGGVRILVLRAMPRNNASIGRRNVSPSIETKPEHAALESKPDLDAKDWHILEALQRDARLGYAELGRKVKLSAPAVAERVKRLGYRIEAMVRLRCDGGICARIGQIVVDIPEVLDCRRLAGEDSALLRVV